MEPVTTLMAVIGVVMSVGGALEAMRRRGKDDAKAATDAHEADQPTAKA
jgi:hypothetical protein